MDGLSDCRRSIPYGAAATLVLHGPTAEDDLFRRCPACKSQNVRRSSFREGGRSRLGLFSPYRCRNCGRHFSVISQKFQRFLTGVGGWGIGATVVVLSFAAVTSFFGAMVPELLAYFMNSKR